MFPGIRTGVRVPDLYQVLADPAVTDNWRANIGQSDGTHYTGFGASIAGKVLFKELDSIIPRVNRTAIVNGEPDTFIGGA